MCADENRLPVFVSPVTFAHVKHFHLCKKISGQVYRQSLNKTLHNKLISGIGILQIDRGVEIGLGTKRAERGR